jgi:methyl-accepting chemotaxis protein
MVVLIVIVGVISVISLNSVVSSKDRVINVNSRLLTNAQSLSASAAIKSDDSRGYLLTGNQHYLTERTTVRHVFLSLLQTIKHSVSSSAERSLVNTIAKEESAQQQATNAVIALRQENGVSLEAVGQKFASSVDPKFAKLESAITAFDTLEEKLLTNARQASSNDASTAAFLVIAIAIAALLIAAVFAFILPRALRRQIGTAVGEVKSSSTELQATAGQQATGAKEQATAMNEISTTLSELLATSRQIAESAQKVSQVAEQTAGAGRSGEQTISTAQESISDIRRQVDIIVDHMLELGEKSQQIGIVLDIVAELAEQTNILAINATIEAAGAGESGKRFAVVADEIRKLADRVAESTKEIRSLIDIVRGAVNTTVMATEIGSKAVDTGSEQFTNVADAFGEIATLVATTTDAAREIELSTKQQMTAVEQVNVAISNVAQTTNEAEASSNQTYQTASQLTAVAESLVRLVEPETVG